MKHKWLSWLVAFVALTVSGLASAAGRWEFAGGSGSDFVDFVHQHGVGTYVITGEVAVTSSIVLDVSNITITSNTMSTEAIPVFKISASGIGIDVTGNNVEFQRISFVAANPETYTGTLVRTRDAQRTRYIESTWEYGKGIGLLEDHSFATMVRGPHMVGIEGSQYGTAIHVTNHAVGLTVVGEGYGRGIFYGGIAVYMDDAEGVYMEKLMSFATRQGLFMNPVRDNSIINIVLNSVNFDSTNHYGNPVRSWNGHGNFKITRLFFQNCWMYSDISGGPAYQFDTPVETVSILGGYAKSGNPAFPEEFVFNSTVTDKIVDNVQSNN